MFKRRLIVMLILITIVPIAVIWVFNFFKLRRDIVNMVYREEQSMTEKIKKDVENRIELSKSHLDYLSNRKEIVSFLASGRNQSSALAVLENNLYASRLFNGYFLIDDSAMQVAKTYKDKSIPVRYSSLSDQNYATMALKGEFSISDVVVPELTDKPVVIFAYPVRGPENEVIGALCGLMEVERLYEIIKDLRLTPNSYGFITDRYGTAIAHFNKEMILTANFFEDVQIAADDARKVREDTSGLLKYVFQNQKKHFFFKKIPETGWIVAYAIPVKDLYLEVNKMMYFTIGVSVVVIIMSVFAALFISRKITNPLDKIIKGVEKIKKGNFDFKLDLKTGDEFQLFSETFNDMVSSLKERDLVKEAFGKYVSNQVLDEILNGKVALGGEMKNITVLFSDIRDFTKLSSKMEPAKVVKFLNDYFSSMVDVVFKHGGSIDKFLGDGLMALFGAPISYHDSARRAVDAAIEMRIKLSEINVRRELEGEEPIDIGVSLHTGECIVGNIGTQQKMEYTAVGDVVNITSRLEELNKEFKTHVIITEATYQHVADFVKVQPLPEVQIRGRSESIKIYEVLSKKPTA